MSARELDNVAYEKVIESDHYDEFITECKGFYRGAGRTAQVMRYLVLLVMFSRTALEPVKGRETKMEALFLWATGKSPTTKGKAGRLGAALRVSHFLFKHGEYMDAFVLHGHFTLNSVIECRKPLLENDDLLTRLFDELVQQRHSPAQVAELANNLLSDEVTGEGTNTDEEQEEEEEEEKEVEEDEKKEKEKVQKQRRTPAPRTRLLSIKALKEDDTYLVQLSNRSRCVSWSKEKIVSVKGGAAILSAFQTASGTEATVQVRPEERTVLEVNGRRGNKHKALLQGNTCLRWYVTTQLLTWRDGQAKVEEYDAEHPLADAVTIPHLSVVRDEAYYIDQLSKEPFTDPYTLNVDGHRESYNRRSWQSMLDNRRTLSPVLNKPIEFYQVDGLTVFLPQPDPALKAEVALWLLTLQGKAYTAADHPAPHIPSSTVTAPTNDLEAQSQKDQGVCCEPRLNPILADEGEEDEQKQQQQRLSGESTSTVDEDGVSFASTSRELNDNELLDLLQHNINKEVNVLPPTPYRQLDALLGNSLCGQTYAVSIINTFDGDTTLTRHWMAFLVDPTGSKDMITIVDPLRQGSHRRDVKSVVQEAVARHFPNTVPLVRFVPLGIQDDLYNCGVWCLEICRLFAENKVVPSREALNVGAVADLRKRYSDQLYPSAPSIYHGCSATAVVSSPEKVIVAGIDEDDKGSEGLSRSDAEVGVESMTRRHATSARHRLQVRSTDPAVDRIALMTDLASKPKSDEATQFLTDNVVAFFMEALNHHNALLNQRDNHAYCFDPLAVARAEKGDGYGLRAADPVAADTARYWLLPRNLPHSHW